MSNPKGWTGLWGERILRMSDLVDMVAFNGNCKGTGRCCITIVSAGH